MSISFKQSNDYQILATKLMYSDAHNLIIEAVKAYVTAERETTAETALAEFVFDNIEAQSLTILSVLTLNGKRNSIQSMIGMISSALLAKDLDAGKVTATHLCVAELILCTPSVFTLIKTPNAQYAVSSPFYSAEEDQKKLFQLPSFDKSTKRHKALGAFKWNPTTVEAVNKLNQIPIVPLDFEETCVPPKGSEDRVKYDVRAAMRPAIIESKAPMYFDWNMDYRGRMYSSGYHFNQMGNEYEKNSLAFYHGVNLANDRNKFQEAEYQIQLAIAVAFGKDKLTDEKKIEWFIHHDEKDLVELDWKLAKEPTYARAQLESLRLLRTTGFTNIPVELDATCSQKQIISVLTGDAKTAQCCNVLTDNSHVQDAYRMVADKMSELSGLHFNRTQIKQSDMIDGYGAGNALVTQQLKDDLKEHYFDGVVDFFYAATTDVCPMAGEVKSLFQSIWNSERTHWSWTLPDGFVTDYRTVQSRKITIKPFGMMEIELIASMIMPTSRNSALGVNVIHSVDAYIARQLVVRCPFDVVSIHDGFRCLPHNAPEMRRIYNEIMAEIVDSTLLEDILFEITGKAIPPLRKQFSGSDVMKSQYSIC